MPLRRVIYTEIEAFILGPMTEVCPDVQIRMTQTDPDSGALVELDPADVSALVFITDDGATIFALNPISKNDLIKTLTGGVQIAGAGELHKLGGL